jgi:hypothetical protein
VPQVLGKPAALDVSEVESATGDSELRPAAAMRDMAVVFTLAVARYGLFYGDDGKSVQARRSACPSRVKFFTFVLCAVGWAQH